MRRRQFRRMPAGVFTPDFERYTGDVWRHRRRRTVAGRTVRASAKLARQGYARRRPLAPLYAAVLLQIAGVVLSVASKGANTAGVLALVGGGLLWWRGRRRRWSTREWRYAWAVFAAAVLWLVTAAAVGAGPPMPGILAVGMLIAAIPWWWHHRIRPYVQSFDDRQAVWAEKVASVKGALPGSQLVDVADIPTGWMATIQLAGGEMSTDAALRATRRIASAYRLPATSVVVEALLTGEEDQARLLVLAENPLREVRTFPGPSLERDTGWITIGVHADGSPARWRLYAPQSGACHGMIAGTTGSGKSALINLLAAEIRLSGLAVLWIADPEGGESVPDWQEGAHWFAGTLPEIRRMLQAAERVMNGRKERRSREKWADDQGRIRRGRGRFEPTPDMPLLCLLVEESPDVLDDAECRRIVASIGKKGRKHGVSVTIVTQVPSLAELGGDLTIRSMLSSTNIVMFRTSDRLSRQMGMPADLPVDPASLPAAWPDGQSTAGLGYLGSPGGRISAARGWYVDDPYHWATVKADTAELETAAIADAGRHYLTWQERRERGEDEHNDPPAPVAGPVALALTAGTIAETGAGTTRDAILAFLRAEGQTTSGVIAQQLDVPLPTVSTTLRRLEQAGLAHQVRRGVWIAAQEVLDASA